MYLNKVNMNFYLKSSNIPSSSKGKSNRRTVVNDAASGWSNENAEESGGQ